MAKKNWIAGAVKHPGAFTAKAKAAGMSTQAYASKVAANPTKYPSTTVKQANLAKTLRKIGKGK